MRSALAALVIVAGILMAGVGAVAVQYEDSVLGANDEQTFNETFTVDEGTVHTFAESNRDVIYNSTVTVKQSGTLIEQDGNYTWHEGNGTLTVLLGSDLTDGADASNEYQLTAPQDEQRLLRNVGNLPAQLGDGILIALTAAVVLGALYIVTNGRRF